MKVVNVMLDYYDIYVGRGNNSKWGNPFSNKKDTSAKWRVSSVEEAISSYEAWIVSQPELMAALPELKDKVLGCWCAPRGGVTEQDVPFICHAQVLAKLANGVSK